MDNGLYSVKNEASFGDKPTAASLGIVTKKPKFGQYSNPDIRKESYHRPGTNWPLSCPIPVDDLVNAGLVYTGVGDSVRCYHCGGGLRNWESGDNPWAEHARYYPSCPHVLLVKGKEYVDRISNEEEDCPPQPLNTCLKMREEDVAIGRVREEEELLSSEAAQATLEYCHSESDVLKAIKIFKIRNGHDNFNASSLLAIIYELEDNPKVYDEALTIEKLQTDGACASSIKNEDIEQLEAENEQMKAQRTCMNCKVRYADVIFLPCGHIVSCGQCAAGKIDGKCWKCSSRINGLVKAIFTNLSEVKEDMSLKHTKRHGVET